MPIEDGDIQVQPVSTAEKEDAKAEGKAEKVKAVNGSVAEGETDSGENTDGTEEEDEAKLIALLKANLKTLQIDRDLMELIFPAGAEVEGKDVEGTDMEGYDTSNTDSICDGYHLPDCLPESIS